MAFKRITYFIVIYAFATCLIKGFPADSDVDSQLGLKCAGGQFTYTDKLKATLETCVNTTSAAVLKKLNNLEGENVGGFVSSMRSCIVICLGQGLGILDVAGKPVKDKIASSVKEIFPAAAAADITKGATACAEKFEKTLVLKDGDCTSYNELVDCTLSHILKVCKG